MSLLVCILFATFANAVNACHQKVVIKRSLARMQRAILAGAFATWMWAVSLEDSHCASLPPPEAEQQEEEEEEDSSFISFLQNAIVATIEATKEIGLKGTSQCIYAFLSRALRCALLIDC